MLPNGSARQKIASAIAKLIADNVPEVYGNSHPILKFWDEVQDWPHISTTSSSERREYLPGSFEWGYVQVNIRVYVKSEDSALDELEGLLVKIEKLLRDNNELNFGNCSATNLEITSIDTDGGLLTPHGVGEIVAVVQYQVN